MLRRLILVILHPTESVKSHKCHLHHKEATVVNVVHAQRKLVHTEWRSCLSMEESCSPKWELQACNKEVGEPTQLQSSFVTNIVASEFKIKMKLGPDLYVA